MGGYIGCGACIVGNWVRMCCYQVKMSIPLERPVRPKLHCAMTHPRPTRQALICPVRCAVRDCHHTVDGMISSTPTALLTAPTYRNTKHVARHVQLEMRASREEFDQNGRRLRYLFISTNMPLPPVFYTARFPQEVSIMIYLHYSNKKKPRQP